MSRPYPLRPTTSSRPDYQSLTPRTPHSRAEAGLSDVDIGPPAEDEMQSYSQQQCEPLLPSSQGEKSKGDDGRGLRGKRSTHTLTRALSYLPLVFGIVIALFLLFLTVLSYKQPDVLQKYLSGNNTTASANGTLLDQTTSPSSSLEQPSMSEQPHQTTPAIPTDRLVSYENYTQFPLTGYEYRHECQKVMGSFMKPHPYWSPPNHGPLDVAHQSSSLGTCSTTITYQLDGNVGLLADLALMAQAAGMAREQNRTFIVDDTYWTRGSWTDHFEDVRVTQSGPEPGCTAPDPSELVACPRTAKHWVINSRTAKWHFGHGFEEQYEDPYKIGLGRLEPMYSQGFDSFLHTIIPNPKNYDLIRSARGEYRTRYGKSYISVHLRRGDRMASSWEYHEKQVPISKYAEAIDSTYERLVGKSTDPEPVVYIASDSPEAQAELISMIPDTTWIHSLAASENPELKELASPHEYVQSDFDKLPLDERIRLTRGMIVDFAMLSGMWGTPIDEVPEAVICTITSNVCKTSALGLGWHRAFGEIDEYGGIDTKHNRWVEIDQRNMIIPVWRAFETWN